MARKPFVAGQFYPASPQHLKKQLHDLFLNPFGPGRLPQPKNEGKTEGIIVPHAGYQFSGPAASWGYLSLAESERPECIILIGLSHRGYPTCFSDENWETPLGTVTIDTETVRYLSKKTQIPINNNSHATENSLEVQIPFLQFIYPKVPPLIPLMISDEKDLTALSSIKKSFTLIVSSDFTHYGPQYGYQPFFHDIKTKMYNLDSKAIDHIIARDRKGLRLFLEKTEATICGSTPILSAMTILKSPGKLMTYYTSGDIIGDYTNSVGYAALVFR